MRQDLKPLLPLDAALQIIGEKAAARTTQKVRPLAAALNGVTATDICAPYALPPFDNTAVDGYAFRHADVHGTAGELTIIGQSMAGEPHPATELPPGSAVRIATGGMLPGGCDTIVMQEHCTREGDRLRFAPVPPLGSSVRRKGNDIDAGDLAISAGHTLRPQDIALIGALGLTEVAIRRPLRIAIASTGMELREAGATLAAGQIIDTNSLMLAQLLAASGAVITRLPALPDAYDATAAALTGAAAAHDIIITSGGVSVGGRDYVRDVLHDKGQVHCWRLAIKPGKPVLLGQIGDCFMAGLPGNPVSAMVTFFLIVQPLIRALNGQSTALPPAFEAKLAAPIDKETHLRVFPRVSLRVVDGIAQALPYRDQSSNLIHSLAAADGLLDLPIGVSRYAAGERVAFRPFTGLFR